MKEQKDWNIFFAEVVDETLKQIFKEDGVKVIYDFLENNSHLRLEDVANKPEVLADSLEKLMLSSAQVIEEMILNNTYSKLGLKFEKKQDHKFPDYLNELKRK
ncbi:MAG: hypothetical protein NWF06_03955 [Candidatus Bathyarchaeota archaeon]|nr:hypothetical protein [Candidatus Bathyarchaeum sp.]